MRRRRSSPNIIVVVGTITIAIILISVIIYSTSPSQQAKRTVDQFYTLEQDGRYSSSWELFHPLMQERFIRSHYIQDRAHVFMSHFGVETFSYSLGRPTRVNNWQKSAETDPFDRVYKIKVEQVFKGKYGTFRLIQDVFVAKENNHWQILWDYNK